MTCAARDTGFLNNRFGLQLFNRRCLIHAATLCLHLMHRGLDSMGTN